MCGRQKLEKFDRKLSLCRLCYQKWCENGTIGNEWDVTWNWLPGTNGLPATSVCCVCGGKGVISGSYGKITLEEKIEL